MVIPCATRRLSYDPIRTSRPFEMAIVDRYTVMEMVIEYDGWINMYIFTHVYIQNYLGKSIHMFSQNFMDI